MTDTFLSLWFLVIGLIGILRPTFCFRSDKLTPEKIERNTRICRWCGSGFVVCGSAGLAIKVFVG